MAQQNKIIQQILPVLEDTKRQLERLRLATTFPGSEELKRQLDQIRVASAFPALETIKKQFDQMRAATALPASEEVKRQPDHIRVASVFPALETIKKQFDQMRAATALPASEELKRQLDQIRVASAFPALETIKKQFDQMRAATAFPGSEALKRQLDQIRATTTITALDDFKHQLEQLRETTALPGSQELTRNLEILASVSSTQSNLARLAAALAQQDFSATLNTYAKTTVYDDQLHDLRLQGDGSVIVDGEHITTSDIQSALKPLFEQPETLLGDVSSYLAQLRKPVRKIVTFLLQAFLGALIQVIITPYIDQSTTLQFQEIKAQLHLEEATTRRDIKTAIKALEQSNRDFSQWRVVSSARLAVKIKRTNKAKTIAILPLGTVVRVLEKQSYWAMIEYESPDTNLIEKGWVFSKNLKRIG